jgi:inner membrane protein
LNYLHWHRHITHSLAALPLVALAPLLVIRLFGRITWTRAWCVSMIGVGSHLLMDWTNMYGIRLLLPFSSRWLRLDILNVVDLCILAVLLLAVVSPLLSRLVSSEIGARAGSGAGLARVALTFILLYAGGRVIFHSRAVAVLESHVYDGATPSRVAALPHFANPFRWIGLVETSSAFVVVPVDLSGSFDPDSGPTLRQAESNQWVDAARNTQAVRRFLEFSQFPYWRVTPAPDSENGTLVEVMDVRFGTPPQERFVTSVLVGPGLKILESRFSFGPVRPGSWR